MKPRALDLFCCAGGASMGLHQAGYDVTGVDIAPQPRYPFRFIQADALTIPLDGYDLIWASPPCQAYSRATVQQRQAGVDYPDVYHEIRARLVASGTPWIIENVPLSPVGRDSWFVELCGQAFGLRLLRHRRFESSHLLLAPPHRPHTGLLRGINADYVCVVTNAWKKSEHKDDRVGVWREAMGIDWMTKRELSQAIPPAYSRFLAEQLQEELAHADN